MEEHIDVMVSGRICPKKPVIQGMRDPSQGMPIRLVEAREGPANRLPGWPSGDMGVVQDVLGVVEVDEAVSNNRVVNHQTDRDQQQTEHSTASFRRGKESQRNRPHLPALKSGRRRSQSRCSVVWKIIDSA